MTDTPKTRKPTRKEQLILSNSIERVINTTLEVISMVGDPEPRAELVEINGTDWEALKEVTVDLWNEARDRIFRELHGAPSEPEEHITFMLNVLELLQGQAWRPDPNNLNGAEIIRRAKICISAVKSRQARKES